MNTFEKSMRHGGYLLTLLLINILAYAICGIIYIVGSPFALIGFISRKIWGDKFDDTIAEMNKESIYF